MKSNIFNVSDLREHIARREDLPQSAPPQPPPVFTDPDGVPSYEIDKIIAHELKRGGVKYLIRWQGFAAADDTWDTEKNLLTQEGGRVAVGQYRARRQIVEASFASIFSATGLNWDPEEEALQRRSSINPAQQRHNAAPTLSARDCKGSSFLLVVEQILVRHRGSTRESLLKRDIFVE